MKKISHTFREKRDLSPNFSETDKHQHRKSQFIINETEGQGSHESSTGACSLKSSAFIGGFLSNSKISKVSS